jgi:hypothetical protein
LHFSLPDTREQCDEGVHETNSADIDICPTLDRLNNKYSSQIPKEEEGGGRRRNVSLRLFGVALFVLLVISGCQYAAVLAPFGTSYIHGQSLGTYKNIKADITDLSSDKTRIYIYRPQRFLGAAVRNVVIVNGKWIGGTVDPPKILLTPGSVFIVDSPIQQNKIWLQQDKGGEDDTKLGFSSGNGEAIYLRLSMKPTSSYLAITDKSTAKEEIQGLNFMGHFVFSKDLDSVCNVTLPTTKLDYVVISEKKLSLHSLGRYNEGETKCCKGSI